MKKRSTITLRGEFRSHCSRSKANATLVSAASRSQNLLAELLASSAQEYVSPYFLARVYVALDDHDGALHALQVALATGTAWAPVMPVEPVFAPLKKYRRFTAMETAIRRGSAARSPVA